MDNNEQHKTNQIALPADNPKGATSTVPQLRPREFHLLGWGLGGFTLFFLTVCVTGVCFTGTMLGLFITVFVVCVDPAGTNVEVVNVNEDPQSVYVIADKADGPSILRRVRGFHIVPEDPKDAVFTIDEDICDLGKRHWDEAKRYGILIENKEGQWRLWWVTRDKVNISGDKATLSIPDTPPETLSDDEVERRFDILPRDWPRK